MRTPSPFQNQLLGALSKAEFERLAPELELIQMHQGEILCEPGDPLRHAYFPTSSIVSMLYLMENGGSIEVAMTGYEGMVGIALCMGGETMPNQVVVRSAGYGYRLRRNVLIRELERSTEAVVCARVFQPLLLRYTQALLTQMAQTAACNRHHTVSQQLSRWLLQTFDRLPSDEIFITHELIAQMLGVRREGISEAAAKLQRAKLIDYRRGHIRLLDRKGLEAQACECYQVVKTEFGRLLPKPFHGQASSEPHPASNRESLPATRIFPASRETSRLASKA